MQDKRTFEEISSPAAWKIFHDQTPRKMLPTSAGLNPQPPGLQSDVHPTEPPGPQLLNRILSLRQN